MDRKKRLSLKNCIFIYWLVLLGIFMTLMVLYGGILLKNSRNEILDNADTIAEHYGMQIDKDIFSMMEAVNAIYVNLYKVQKDERKYLWSVVKMLIVAIIYNIIGMLIWNNIESIAFATTFSFITWYFYAMRHFPALKSDWKELLYLCLVLISFLLCSHISNYFIGAVIYLIILIVGIVLFFKDLLKASVIKGFIFGIRQKK